MNEKKIICINVPCYNEEDNIIQLATEIEDEMNNNLPEYNFIIQFIDNCSTDSTQSIIRKMCSEKGYIRAIFNSKNFKSNSALYGMMQAKEDAVIYLSADFQDPIEKIHELVRKWEEGYLIVAAIKKSNKDNCLKSFARNIFYKIMHKFSKVGFIEQFCNFGIYDKKFWDIICDLDNPYYSIRGNVAEFGYDIGFIEYEQPMRRNGKSNYNVFRLFDLAIDNFVNYTDVIIRFFTIFGGFSLLSSGITWIVFLILNIVFWKTEVYKFVFFIICFSLILSFQMFSIGIMGEYLLAVKKSSYKRPLVVEKERINF